MLDLDFFFLGSEWNGVQGVETEEGTLEMEFPDCSLSLATKCLLSYLIGNRQIYFRVLLFLLCRNTAVWGNKTQPLKPGHLKRKGWLLTAPAAVYFMCHKSEALSLDGVTLPRTWFLFLVPNFPCHVLT